MSSKNKGLAVNIFARILIFTLILTPISLMGREVQFKSSFNFKEFTLRWEGDFVKPTITISRGLPSGYALAPTSYGHSISLDGAHIIKVRTYRNSDFLHIVVREERAGNYNYVAWSVPINESGDIYTHNLTSFETLRRESEIESSNGSQFKYKKVMRVPRTDKFISLKRLNHSYLKCQYLSKLMGDSVADSDCHSFERMNYGVSTLGSVRHSCQAKIFRDDLSFSHLQGRLDDFVNCLDIASDIKRACMRSYLKSGNPLSKCLHDSEASSETLLSSDDCIDESNRCEIKKFLDSRLRPLTKIEYRFEDRDVGITRIVTLPVALAEKLVLSNCFYRFLANGNQSAESLDFAQEAFYSCYQSLESGLKHGNPAFAAYMAKWISQKITSSNYQTKISQQQFSVGQQLSYWIGKELQRAPADNHFDLPMLGHFRSGLNSHYQNYARHLLQRGFLEHALESDEDQRQSVLRAPASVSQ